MRPHACGEIALLSRRRSRQSNATARLSPTIWNPNKKAIFEAWEKLKGMDMEEARKEYLIIAKE